MGKRGITDRQIEVFVFVREYVREHGYGPTSAEAAAAIGIKPGRSILHHLRQLHEAGWITLGPQARQIDVTYDGPTCLRCGQDNPWKGGARDEDPLNQA